MVGLKGPCMAVVHQLMEGFNFESWFCTKFVPLTHTEKPRLFKFDGHNFHISYKVAKMAFDNKIHILCLPPHTSHVLQPLDVACLRPTKAIWSDIVLTFYRKHIKLTLGKAEFPSLI